MKRGDKKNKVKKPRKPVWQSAIKEGKYYERWKKGIITSTGKMTDTATGEEISGSKR